MDQRPRSSIVIDDKEEIQREFNPHKAKAGFPGVWFLTLEHDFFF